MAIPLAEWYYEVPVITRTYMTAAMLTSLAVQLDVVTPFWLYFNQDLTFFKHQYWRLITNFLYFGPFNLDFLFHMFFLVRYSRMLEEGSFRSRTADYFWLLVVAGFALLWLSKLTTMPFLGSALAFTLVYIWARRNPFVRLNFLGLFVFNAPYLPWVLFAFSMLLNPSIPTGDLMGIVVGHVYYFFEDVWPNERESGGMRLLRTPRLIERLFESRQDYAFQEDAIWDNETPQDTPEIDSTGEQSSQTSIADAQVGPSHSASSGSAADAETT